MLFYFFLKRIFYSLQVLTFKTKYSSSENSLKIYFHRLSYSDKVFPLLCCENPLLSAAWSECGKRSLIPSVKRFCPDVVCLPLFRLIINSWNRKTERKKNLLFFPLEFIIHCPGHICVASYCSDKRRELKFCFRFCVILFIIWKNNYRIYAFTVYPVCSYRCPISNSKTVRFRWKVSVGKMFQMFFSVII